MFILRITTIIHKTHPNFPLEHHHESMTEKKFVIFYVSLTFFILYLKYFSRYKEKFSLVIVLKTHKNNEKSEPLTHFSFVCLFNKYYCVSLCNFSL